MDNGCVCCTVRGDLIKAFKQLKKRMVDDDMKFDGVIIETTGLADPGPVTFTINANQDVADDFRIDSILTMVDAKHVMQHLEEEKPDGAVNEAVQQVAFADKILLNKTDLVTADYLEDTKCTLSSVNAFAEIIPCQNARVDLDKIIGLGTFMMSRVEQFMDPEDEKETVEVAEECTDEGCTVDHDHGHGHGHEHSGHGAHAKEGGACADDGCTVDHDHGHGHGHDHAEGSGAGACADAGCTMDHDHGHAHGHGHKKQKKIKKRVHDLSKV
jgi:G3E family GTPase